MKKVYVAASFAYADREKTNKRKQEIEEVVSLIKDIVKDEYDFYIPHQLKIPNAWDISLEEWSLAVYNHDVSALDNADIVIFISYGKENNAGAVWEAGYAKALNKKIVMIKMTDEVESLMLFGSVTSIIMKDEIVTYDWKTLPEYKTKLYKMS